MTEPVTIHGELLLPASVLQDHLPADVERWLHAAGMLPALLQPCRWRPAPEALGYLLSYEVTLTLEKART